MKKLLFLICVLLTTITTVQAQSAQGRLKGKGIKANPPTIYWNTEQEYEATCPGGTSGTPVTVVVLANTISSPTSVSAANALALSAAQTEAEEQLVCSPTPTTYSNTEQSYTASCPSGYIGSSVTVTKAAGTYTSLVSVAEANTFALNAAIAESNASLVCSQITYSNTLQSYTATCPSGYTGTAVTVTKSAGTYTSTISVATANQLALTAATNEANATLSCTVIPPTYTNTEQSYTATCPSGYTGAPVTVTKTAGTYSSTISILDANSKALAAATAEAQAAITCTVIPTVYSNTQQSYTANCPTGTTGSSVTVIKAAGTFTSTISIADANAKALAAATSEANAQLNCVTTGFNLSAYPALRSVPSPGISAPGDAFVENAAASPNSNAPQISEWTRSDNTKTGAKQTFVNFSGDNLSGIAANGITVYDGGSLQQAVIGDITGKIGSARLPSSAFKFRVVWFENASGKGTPIMINKTEVFWAQTSIVAGQSAYVYGRNLAHGNIEGTTNSYVYLQPTAGGTVTAATVTEVTPYRVKYTTPALANGNYYVWVHNGHGGDKGWSRATVAIISAASHVKAKTWGAETNVAAASGTAATNVTNINSAVAAVGTSGGVVKFQAGVYTINDAININSTSKWSGAALSGGANTTIIRLSATFTNSGEGVLNRSGALNMTMLENITLEANGFQANGNDFLALSNSTMIYLKHCTLDARLFRALTFNSPSNIFIEDCTIIGGEDSFGSPIFLDGGSQMFWTGNTILMTKDCGAAINNKAVYEVDFGSNTIQDRDNTTTDGSGWGKGRIWSSLGAGGTQYNLYFHNNLGQGLGVRMSGTNLPDANSGEVFLWEGNSVQQLLPVVSATTTTVTFSTPVSLWVNGDPMDRQQVLYIVSGKGAGQQRLISGPGGLTVSVASAWMVVPDNTSVIEVAPFCENLVIYKNNINANGKSYIASNPDNNSTASTAVSFYGGIQKSVFDGNTVTGMRSGFISHATWHNGSQSDINAFIDCINNSFNGCRYSIAIRTENATGGVSTVSLPLLIATNVDGNMISGNIMQTWPSGSYVPNFSYQIYNFNSTYAVPPVQGITFSNNNLNGSQTSLFDWWGMGSGQGTNYPNGPALMTTTKLSGQILYNNN